MNKTEKIEIEIKAAKQWNLLLYAVLKPLLNCCHIDILRQNPETYFLQHAVYG